MKLRSQKPTSAAFLGQESTVISVQEQLSDGARAIDTLARTVFAGPDASNDLVKLVDLAVAARTRSDDAPLLPARYHFWVGSLDGGYLCQHPSHPAGKTRLQLNRHERCPECSREGRRSHMVEIGVCRSCGTEYAVGKIRATGLGDQLQVLSDQENPDYLLLNHVVNDDTTDEDAEALCAKILGPVEESKGIRQRFDVENGVLYDLGPVRGRDSGPQTSVTKINRHGSSEPLRRCAVCSSTRRDEVVSRFRTGADAPLSVVATELYQSLPPSADPEQNEKIGEGRKLLTFADSRQDAAYSAPYLNRTYERAVVRRLVLNAIRKNTARYGAAPRFDAVVDEVLLLAEDALVLDPDKGRVENIKQAERWVSLEALALDRRQSLDGLGLVDIRLALPKRNKPPAALIEAGLNESESTDIVLLFVGHPPFKRWHLCAQRCRHTSRELRSTKCQNLSARARVGTRRHRMDSGGPRH